MAQEKVAREKIEDGPSKLDLMLALFDVAGAYGKFRPVSFTLEGGQSVGVHIGTVHRDDGSGENWGFIGYTVGREPKGIKGFFSTKNRNGWIEFDDSLLWSEPWR